VLFNDANSNAVLTQRRTGREGTDEWLEDSFLGTGDRGLIQCIGSMTNCLDIVFLLILTGEDVSEAGICTRPWIKLGSLSGSINRARPYLRTRRNND
jgi:hypothetical protein